MGGLQERHQHEAGGRSSHPFAVVWVFPQSPRFKLMVLSLARWWNLKRWGHKVSRGVYLKEIGRGGYSFQPP